MFPKLPPWDGMHVLIVHFPIGILLVVPVLLIVGLLAPSRGRGYSHAALLLMGLGLIAVFFAVATGGAAEEAAEPVSDTIENAIHEHEELAEQTRIVFVILTALYAALVAAPMVMKDRWTRKHHYAGHAVFLILYMAGALMLINTGDRGGMLVHRYGLHAVLAQPAGAPAPVDDHGSDERSGQEDEGRRDDRGN